MFFVGIIFNFLLFLRHLGSDRAFIAFVVCNEEGKKTLPAFRTMNKKIPLHEKKLYILNNHPPINKKKRDHLKFEKRGLW